MTTGADSEQPVQLRVTSGAAEMQESLVFIILGGPAYICRDQRKHVFHNMGSELQTDQTWSPSGKHCYSLNTIKS